MATQLVTNGTNYTKGLPVNNSKDDNGGGAQDWRQCSKWNIQAHMNYVHANHLYDQCDPGLGWDYKDVYVAGQPTEYVFPDGWFVVAGRPSTWEAGTPPGEDILATNWQSHWEGNVSKGATQDCLQLVTTTYDGTEGHKRVRVDNGGSHNYPNDHVGGTSPLTRVRTTTGTVPNGTKGLCSRNFDVSVTPYNASYPAVSAVCVFQPKSAVFAQQFELRTDTTGRNLRVIFKNDRTRYEWYNYGQQSYEDLAVYAVQDVWHRLLLNMWHNPPPADERWWFRFKLQKWVSGAWSTIKDYNPGYAFVPCAGIYAAAFGDESPASGEGTVYYERTNAKRSDSQAEYNDVTAGNAL